MEHLFNNKNTKYIIEMDIIDKGNFFNMDKPYHCIVKPCKLANLAKTIYDLVDDYAYELDTEPNNLEYSITNLKIWED